MNKKFLSGVPDTRSQFRRSYCFPQACVLSCALALPNLAVAEVTIAFVGDQGWTDSAREVLQLIEDEGADLLMALGDLGYEEPGGAEGWINNIESVFEPDFPVLAVVGNHENREWPVYQRWLAERAAAVPELKCEGVTGVKEHCRFRGVSFVQVAPGIGEVAGVLSEDGYPEYIEQEFAEDPSPWRICSWHKNQRAMQTGVKSDDTGWGVYQACQNVGGIVATGHEHAYSRTYLMSDFENQTVIHREDHLELGPDRSFAFVSGLGGNSVRSQLSGGDWWASIWTSTQGGAYGALFCTFGETLAECRFVDITGAVPDRFTLESASGFKSPDIANSSDVPEPDPGSISETGDAADVGANEADELESENEPSIGQASGSDSVDPESPGAFTGESASPDAGVDTSKDNLEGSGAMVSAGGVPSVPVLLGLLGMMLARVLSRARH